MSVNHGVEGERLQIEEQMLTAMMAPCLTPASQAKRV